MASSSYSDEKAESAGGKQINLDSRGHKSCPQAKRLKDVPRESRFIFFPPADSALSSEYDDEAMGNNQQPQARRKLRG